MSISVFASRSRQRAVLAGTAFVAAVAIIGLFESHMVEMAPAAPTQPTMQAHVTVENVGIARVSGSAMDGPVSYRLVDDQDDWDQLQNQINIQQQLNQQMLQQSEQEAQQQNDAAEQQAQQDEQQAQMDEQQAAQ
jgi:hypothetical protein